MLLIHQQDEMGIWWDSVFFYLLEIQHIFILYQGKLDTFIFILHKFREIYTNNLISTIW